MSPADPTSWAMLVPSIRLKDRLKSQLSRLSRPSKEKMREESSRDTPCALSPAVAIF